MAHYECEQCDGYGTRFTWRWPFIVGCDACNGDGHARPPKDSVRPEPPPAPPLPRETASEYRNRTRQQTTLWIVGKIDDPEQWECCGVFDCREIAIANCETEQHFVGPLTLNEFIGPRSTWPGAWYPKLQEEPANQ